jgi:hypothetical protein
VATREVAQARRHYLPGGENPAGFHYVLKERSASILSSDGSEKVIDIVVPA